MFFIYGEGPIIGLAHAMPVFSWVAGSWFLSVILSGRRREIAFIVL